MDVYLELERASYYIYKYIISDNDSTQFADDIFNTICSYKLNNKNRINAWLTVNNILKKDYNTNLFSLAFEDKKLKETIVTELLFRDLRKLLNNNSISFNEVDIYKFVESSIVKNSNIDFILDKIYESNIKI